MPATPSKATPTGNHNKLVIIAVIVAVIAVILQMVYIEAVRSQATPDTFRVYRLAVSYEAGDTLRERDLEENIVPEQFKDVFLGAITSEDLQNYVGEELQQSARQNEVLTFDLFEQSIESKLVNQISPGMRLIALPVDNKRLRGVLRPGTSVDLIATFSQRAGLPRVLPVMENVKVMAVGQRSLIEEQENTGRQSTNFTHIHIQVTPLQWRALSILEKLSIGPFEVAMRNPGDLSQGMIQAGEINPILLDMIDMPIEPADTANSFR